MPLRLACLTLLLSASLLRAEDWPAWRGPRLDGASSEKKFPTSWSATENVAWKTPLAGIGHSSPIVSNGRIFLTTCMLDDKEPAKRRMLLCLDRKDGKILWEKEILRSVLEPKHGLNSYSSATPFADGKHVYVAVSQLRPRMDGEIAPKSPRGTNGTYLETYKKDESLKTMASEMVVSCYDFDGKLVWRKIPGQFYCRHGFCTTPIPYQDTIILNADQDAEAYIVSLDKATGDEKWRINRERRIRSYCAPLIVHAAGRDQLILSGAETVTSYDPLDGKLIWIVQGPTEQTVASPVYAQGLVFLTAGFPTFHNIAIRPDGKGDVTKTHVAWHEDNKSNGMKASYVPSPIAYDKWFYVISDRGPLSCFDAKSGARLYTQSLGRHHTSSPVRAGNLIYIPDDDGITYVIKGGAEFELVAKNEVGDHCYSSPALSDGQILLRTDHWLFCIGK